MQNRQGGRRRRGGTGGSNNPRPMGMAQGSQGANRLEVRVRGNANQLLEKYKVLARDAHQAGDRVATEYYLQHADHYFRVLNDSRIRAEEMRSRRGPFDQLDEEYEPEGDAQDGASDEDDDRGQDQERTQERTQERSRDPNRRPRDDRRYEARAERPQRDADRPQRDADRPQRDDRPQQRDLDRPQRDADRPQRWQQDNRGSEGQRDSQAREGQAREAPVRDYQPRSNGNRHAADEDRSHGDGMIASAADGPRISDGEAALAAFGGPIREAAPRQADTLPEGDAAPAPRKRGRPRKVDVAPVAEG